MPTLTTYSRKRARSSHLDEETHETPALPLQELSSNNAAQPKSKLQRTHKKPRLIQTTIDLGGNPQKTCMACGMEYIPSVAEDVALHKRYHDAQVGGVDVPRLCLMYGRAVAYHERKRLAGVRAKKTPVAEPKDVVFEVDKDDTALMRNTALKVLDVVERELGAIRIDEEELWSVTKKHKSSAQDQSLRSDEQSSRQLAPTVNRYKVYLYVQNKKCVGLCLVERIKSARKVLQTAVSKESDSISTSEEASFARLGISRIWVSKEYRRLKVAYDLLEVVRRNYAGQSLIPKRLIAFSQPTESGVKLARRWFECAYDWLVYDERDTNAGCDDATIDTKNQKGDRNFRPEERNEE